MELDLHVLVRKDTPKDWLRQCFTSIHDAVANAPFPVHVHRLPAVPGHIGRARAAGYAQGTAPYVTYVDDDDYLLPDAFTKIASALAEQPDVVFPHEQVLQNGKFCTGHVRHHLPIYRRDLIIDHTQWGWWGDVAQIRAIERQPELKVIEVHEPVYVYRLYRKTHTAAMKAAYPDELERANG